MNPMRSNYVRHVASAVGIAAVLAAATGLGTAAAAPSQDAGATANFIALNGTTTEVQADSVRYCSTVGFGIPLSSGQELAFDEVQSIDVLAADDRFEPNGTASLQIKLVDGDLLQDSMPANCDLFGQNEIGRFSTSLQDLQRLEFTRPAEMSER
ncbi:hypothetical protein QM806_27785 [Rhodococcus sp. IEGM 1351]|uniref:hypothetical protein n=1 Tax=Rhodococcus sp. IEGM 1351 TaxID=3047089 RepID=UPI0022F2AEFF|nr:MULTISPECIES: hypothetical protein [Rhodococcus]MDI9939191.1 hypothetical protein [Rhodococcus sp. IEGM 1351]GLK33711.1 hypothetical protein GCM10017611_05530 [Rhodococcus wratislaviensis]